GYVELTPHRGFEDQSADIDPWIDGEIKSSFIDTSAGQMMSRIALTNESTQGLRGTVVDVFCNTMKGEERRARTKALNFRSKETKDVTLALNLSECVEFGTSVVQGRW